MMNNKTVLIIGASSGLGRAIALQYVNTDFNIILTSRSVHSLQTLHEIITLRGGSSYVHACDIRSTQDVNKLIADVKLQFGSVDIVIFASAVQYIDPIHKLNIDEVDTMFQTNVVGIIRCCHKILPHMIDRKAGQLVFITSIMGEAAFPQLVSYSATKAAITNFAKGLRREVSSQGIDVTIVTSGHMNTNISAHQQAQLPHWYGKSGSLDVERVASQVIEAIEQRKHSITIGRNTQLLSFFSRIYPRLANLIIRKITT